MKAIRLQIDMVYTVEDEQAQNTYEYDVDFFDTIRKDFDTWATQPNNPRMPISFDFRHHMGSAIKDEEE